MLHHFFKTIMRLDIYYNINIPKCIPPSIQYDRLCLHVVRNVAAMNKK